MKKTVNKFISIIMTFIMIAAMLPLAAFATAEKVSAADSQSVSVTGNVNGRDVTLTVGPFVTDITAKEGTASLTWNVSGGSNPTITWSSSDSETVSVRYGSLTGHRRGSAIITATLTGLDGQAIPESQQISVDVKVNVDFDIRQYAEPGQPTNYEYPDLGGVRIKKTASSDMMEDYGLSEVELDVAGIGVRPGVDVILVVDVSCSMAWTRKNDKSSQSGGDQNRIPEHGSYDYNHGCWVDSNEDWRDKTNWPTKLDDAMDAASAFADIMLENNNGSKYDNTLSFVTFAGKDAEHSVSQTDYIDSVRTVFYAEHNKEAAKRAFNGTYITSNAGVSPRDTVYVNYKLHIGNTSGGEAAVGPNRGNTNYDYAFAEASSAVDQVQNAYVNNPNNGVSSYAESGRDTYVIFMTDGAPSHYNRQAAAGSNTDRWPDAWDTYESQRNGQDIYPNQSDWTNYFLGNRNRYAQALNAKIDNPNRTESNLYAIGFDLPNGGFAHGYGNSWQWPEATLVQLLSKLVNDNGTVPVETTSEPAELRAIFERLAKMLKPAGTQAQVVDTVNTDLFTLQTQGFVIGDIATGGATINLPAGYPAIEVRSYKIYTPATAPDPSQIGDRTGAVDTLERVTFNYAGNEAYSDQINGGTTNIMQTLSDGSIVINGKYFTYKKDVTNKTNGNPTETFTWNIGDIPDEEVALVYDAYLKGSMEGLADEGGGKETNISADLSFTDIDNHYSTKEFDKPVAVWKDAVTDIEYYLVSENGLPCNSVGIEVPFSMRIRVGDIYHETIRINHSQGYSDQTVHGSDNLPAGFELFSPNAYYVVRAASGAQLQGYLRITDNVSPITTIDVDAAEHGGTASDTRRLTSHVAFGVKVPNLELLKDVAVLDYGKPVEFNILEDERANGHILPLGYDVEFDGITAYDSSLLTTTKFAVDSTPIQQKANSKQQGSGVFSVKANDPDVVEYTQSSFMDTVDRVYGTVLFTNQADNQDKYYLLNEIVVMPANNIYYEDDFLEGTSDPEVGFVYTGSWGPDGAKSGNAEIINNEVHGGWIETDTGGLSGDVGYSDGAAHVTDTPGAKVSFSFTGTGVDVYTRTTTDSGKVRAALYKFNDTKNTYTLKLIKNMDNYSGSSRDGYYQIPTLSFSGLDYGKYRLDITAGTVNNTRATYYIDGIRVYNPIQKEESQDADVKKAYGVELGATFENAKDLMDTGKAAFIDQIYHIKITDDSGADFLVDDGTAVLELMRGGNYDPNTGYFLDPDDPTLKVDIKDTKGRDLIVTEGDTYNCDIQGAINITLPSDYKLDIIDGGDTIGDYTSSELASIAPGYEIYLKAGQGIAIKTNSLPGAHYFIGLKALDGTPTVQYADEEGAKSITITHTTDLYYKVVPDVDGFINIDAVGSGKLAITKLRATTGPTRSMTLAAPAPGFAQIGDEDVLGNFRAFRADPVTILEDAEQIGVSEEELVGQEEIVGEAEEIVEEVTELTEDDIVIENTENYDTITEDEANSSEAENNQSSSQDDINQILLRLFGGIRSLFGR